jgi:hypothetical protein
MYSFQPVIGLARASPGRDRNVDTLRDESKVHRPLDGLVSYSCPHDSCGPAAIMVCLLLPILRQEPL